MNEEYLNRVLIYLQQELPSYQEVIELQEGEFVFSLTPGSEFQSYYEAVLAAVSASVARIRNREYDLDFKVWSKNQERNFKILK